MLSFCEKRLVHLTFQLLYHSTLLLRCNCYRSSNLFTTFLLHTLGQGLANPAHRPHSACHLFCEYSFIGTEIGPFIYILPVLHYNERVKQFSTETVQLQSLNIYCQVNLASPWSRCSEFKVFIHYPRLHFIFLILISTLYRLKAIFTEITKAKQELRPSTHIISWHHIISSCSSVQTPGSTYSD